MPGEVLINNFVGKICTDDKMFCNRIFFEEPLFTSSQLQAAICRLQITNNKKYK